MNYANPQTQAIVNQSIEPARVSPAASLLAELQGAQCDTEGLVSRLTAMLSDALAPEMANAKSDGGASPRPVESPICEEIRRRIGQAEYSNARLRDLIDRLTV